MGLFSIEDKDLLAGQQQGYQALEANTGTQISNVQRLMDRYGTANADYTAKMLQAQRGAEGMAKLRLDARLQDAQWRSRLHNHKLQMLRKQYKDQERAQRSAMYGSLIGSASAMAPGVAGMFAPQTAPGAYSYGPWGQSFGPVAPGTSYNQAAEQTMANWAAANGL